MIITRTDYRTLDILINFGQLLIKAKDSKFLSISTHCVLNALHILLA